MSTDILKFENGESEFQLKGLGTYLAIALPLTVLTFFAWYMIYLFARKREESTMRKTYREKDQKLV
jgi:protein-S-isoprenylcysteine O-methyltransferase Ste14